MDKVYIELNELSKYQQLKIKDIVKETNTILDNKISIYQLINLLDDLYMKYEENKLNYEIFIKFIDGKRRK